MIRRLSDFCAVEKYIAGDCPAGGGKGNTVEETNYTYLLQCADGSIYCGWTNHLEERVKAHNTGRGAKYTRSRRPVKLAYYEKFATRQEAMRRERELKKLDHGDKLRLIREWEGKTL